MLPGMKQMEADILRRWKRKCRKAFSMRLAQNWAKKIEDSLGEEGMKKAGKVVDLVNNYFFELGQSKEQKILGIINNFQFIELQDGGWIVLKYPEAENASQKGKNVKQEQKQPQQQNHHVHREHDQQQEHVSEE